MKKNLPVTQKERTFDADANILSTTDLKGRITFMNQVFLDVSGFTQDELMGKPHNIIRHPDMPQQAFKLMWDTIESNRSWTGIVKNRCKNGDHYWVNAFVSPIQKEGKITEYQSVRRKPEPEMVRRAERLYSRLTNGEEVPELNDAVPVKTRLMREVFGVLGLAALMSLVLPAGWMTASMLLLLAILLAGRIRSHFTPIDEAVAKAGQISSDAVSRQVFTGRNDEAGSIMLAFHILESEKKAIIGRVNDSMERLTEAAQHLDGSMQRGQVRGDNLVSQIERVAAAVEEMTATIRDVSDNATRTSEVAAASLSKVQHGKSVIDANVRQLDSLLGEIAGAAGAVQQAATVAGGVTSILDVIKDISEQTRLLSLNATIEAARAGAAGKGFSVVADQVRSLSARTQKSAEEIGLFIEQLRSSTDKATEMMHNAQKKVTDNNRENARSADILNEILTSIQDISTGSSEVAYIVEQQRFAADEINQSLASITTLSQENNADVQHNTRATAGIADTLQDVHNLTTHFWQQKAV
ncbi:MAG: chemotaxis signal relay system methyl-accepting signal transducer Aer [Bacteroidetes bacterium HLUCCA01]|nr:MAG: chemotaxis signal relay system methyl-accepting signal transducer Aer [Bacteroidetes bacterium HLUCCA01]